MQCEENDLWYIFMPHWRVKNEHSDGSVVLTCTTITNIKKRACIQWMDLPASQRHLVSIKGTELHVGSMRAVTDPAEIGKSEWVQHHREVSVTEADFQAMADHETQLVKSISAPPLLKVSDIAAVLSSSSITYVAGPPNGTVPQTVINHGEHHLFASAIWFDGMRPAPRDGGVRAQRLSMQGETFWWHPPVPGCKVRGVLCAVAGAGAGPGPAGSFGPYCLYTRLMHVLAEQGIGVLIPEVRVRVRARARVRVWVRSQAEVTLTKTKRFYHALHKS